MVDPAHVPALLGTALVLAFIIVASIAARLAGGFLRRRQHRRSVSEASPNWDALFADTAAPDITALPAVRRPEPEPREGPRVAKPAREIRHTLDRETLESNVRALLYRLQSDINTKPPGVDAGAVSTEIEPEAPMAPTDSPPSGLVSGDLEAALAVWSGKKALTRH
jgi:hypothetical protein